MSISVIGVVGAGQMGRGIAQMAAMSGYQVWLFDISQGQVSAASVFIEQQLKRGLDKGKWEQTFVTDSLKRLNTCIDMNKLRDCHLVVEAATENKQIKCEIFRELDRICAPGTLLATNTSSISITEIAAVTNRPDKVAGMHFMNPVPVMKLIEGIKGLQTSDQTFMQIADVAKKMGKTFIKVSDIAGFAVNRILMPMINEAVFTLYEGIASVEDIDLAMKLGTNHPMGPLELADFIGLDTCLSIMEVLHDGLGDSKYRACPLLKKYVAAGWLGRKSGRGFYGY